MRTHRFGTKIRLPSSIAIKHGLRKLMFEDLIKEEGLVKEAGLVKDAEIAAEARQADAASR